MIRGFLIGLAVAAPVGPIGILCTRRTLASGMRTGLLSGLGAATADTLYAGIATFGVAAVSAAAVEQAAWIRIVGAAFLFCLGVRTFLSQPTLDSLPVRNAAAHAAAFGSTLFLTLTNPLTILSFAAVMANAGLDIQGADRMAALALVAGVFLGSATWWLMLSYAVSRLRARFHERWMVWVNRAAGFLLAAFGVVSLVGH